jgi:hypothetical protein
MQHSSHSVIVKVRGVVLLTDIKNVQEGAGCLLAACQQCRYESEPLSDYE